MKKIFPIALLILLFICHFPFLTADPDTKTDIHTRGAWTDEGLYTSQVRNYIINGHFDSKENSTFIRGPLLNILQLPFFYVLGSHRLVSRLLVLLITFLVPLLFLRIKGLETFSLFVILVVFSQFHIFHFSHYGLAEMLSIDMIFASLFFLLKSQAEKSPYGHRVFYILLASACIFLAYSFKIQFVYAAAILPLSLFVMAFMAGKDREEAFQQFGVALIFSLVFIGIYAIWYVANKDFYNYIMMLESKGRYPAGILNYLTAARWNFDFFLWVRELKPMWILLLLSSLIVIWERHSRKTDKRSLALWVFCLVWVVLELHKLPMSYMPNRYMISLYFACGLIIAQGLSYLYGRSHTLAWVAIVSGLVFVAFGLPFHHSVYRQRTYDLSRLNTYLSSYSYEGRLGLGSWASAASWGTDLRTIPVWKDYFNADDPIKKFNPAIIVSEADESENDKTYVSQGIDLEAESDSSRIFSVWRYTVVVYWMKNPDKPKE